MITELAQPELLVRLQKDGYHFGLALNESKRLTNADLLTESEAYRSLTGAIEADLDELAKSEPTATTRVINGRNRLFDKRWLSSKYASFDLVDVINRVDRKDFGSGTCGETRFIYRLSYVRGENKVPTFSRLPFFFNVVYEILEGDRAHFKHTASCAAGLSCKSLATNSHSAINLGVCMPDEGGFAGLPCLSGTMADGAIASPNADKLTTTNLGCKGAYACLKPEEGTPAGMCVASCKGKLGEMTGANEICAFGGGAKFDMCAASANFATCIADAVRPAPRQACDDDHPCREDYMCQRLEPIGDNHPITTTPKTKGFCNPTYFIFQMRLDGHPSPQ